MFKFQFGNGPLPNGPDPTTSDFPLIRNALFLISDFLTQGIYLRPELIDDLFKVLDGGQLLTHGRRKISGYVIRRDAETPIG
jgi:hypothetical protein